MRQLIWENGRYVDEETKEIFLGIVPKHLDIGDKYRDHEGINRIVIRVESNTFGGISVVSKEVG